MHRIKDKKMGIFEKQSKFKVHGELRKSNLFFFVVFSHNWDL